MRNMRIAELLFNRPLMISEGKLNVILHALGPRFNLDLDGLPVQETAVLADQDRARSGYYVRDGVAVVGMYGPLLHRVMASDYPSGGPTTYGEIRKAFDTALSDDGVHSILLDIDSPGGEVCGCFDLGDHIYQARSIKPITAVCNEQSYSAAYLLASAAGRIIIPRTGGAGSVGVVATHVDFSRAEDAAGITVTHVYAGAKKVDYSPHRPISSEALADLQASVAETYDLFTSTVARNRGVAESVIRSTEAGCFVGKKAVAIGLADEVAAPDRAIEIARKGVRSTIKMSAVTAATETEEKMDKATLMEKHPELYQSLLAEGNASAAAANQTALATAREEGAATERARIQSVEAACMPGHEKLIAGLKFDGTTTGGEAALQIIGAEKQLRDGALKELVTGANAVVAAVVTTAAGEVEGAAGVDADAPVEERAVTEWDKNPALKSEFTSQEAFVAFRRKQEAGRVRILNKK